MLPLKVLKNFSVLSRVIARPFSKMSKPKSSLLNIFQNAFRNELHAPFYPIFTLYFIVKKKIIHNSQSFQKSRKNNNDIQKLSNSNYFCTGCPKSSVRG